MVIDENYSNLLRAEYKKIMEEFVPDGKEPEDKERFRYLVKMMGFSRLHVDYEHMNVWIEDCFRDEDWTGLCRLLNQRFKGSVMPCIYGGYNYEKNMLCVLEAFACGNFCAMEQILPLELAKVKNANNMFFPAAVHVLLGLWYRDESVLEWAVPAAEHFLEQKKPSMFEKAIVAFLLDLQARNMEKGTQDLLAVCKSYSKDKKYILGVRPFCTFAHGLYCLAQYLLPKDTFEALQMPEYKNFATNFALWRREHTNPDLSLYFRYPEDMKWVNEIYEAPPAKLILWQPFLNSANAKPRQREEWMAHGVKWVNNFADTLWDGGLGKGDGL